MALIDQIANAARESKPFVYETMVASMMRKSPLHTKNFLESHGIKKPLFLLKDEKGKIKKQNFTNAEKIAESFIDFFKEKVRLKGALFELDSLLEEARREFLEKKGLEHEDSSIQSEQLSPYVDVAQQEFKHYQSSKKHSFSGIHVEKYPETWLEIASQTDLTTYADQLLESQIFTTNMLKELAAIRYLLETRESSEKLKRLAVNFFNEFDFSLTKAQRQSLLTLSIEKFGVEFEREINTPKTVEKIRAVKNSIKVAFDDLLKLKFTKTLTVEHIICFIHYNFPYLSTREKNLFIKKYINDEKALQNQLKTEDAKKEVIPIVQKGLLTIISEQKAHISSFKENCQNIAKNVLPSWCPKLWVFGALIRLFCKPDYTKDLSFPSKPVKFEKSQAIKIFRPEKALTVEKKPVNPSPKRAANVIVKNGLTVFSQSKRDLTCETNFPHLENKERIILLKKTTIFSRKR